ncbi:hypothetical protein [Thiolapillus brandeum]|uniref:DUF4412 domain-containing protein n=1 Tax=Thiolapillus brandeum TaxID=1076588 RepID=A0A7U6GIJ6_9GAMM|nr:hypothetical protein [Thiolapillus brandeum]BAO44255.1 hypothetical protein TBH_C1330 [Thiolapillus brandeum]
MYKLILILFLGGIPLFAAAQQASLLVYKVQEPGVENYISRILVTPEKLRMDEGSDSGGYTLYDRRTGRIFNVDPEEQTVIVFEPPATQPQPPQDMTLSIQRKAEPQAPQVEGKTPVSIKLMVNKETCRELLVIDDSMTHAVAALRELYKALARIQYPSAHMPGTNMSACELSEYVYAPQRAWEHGLPLWDIMGDKRRLLVDFRKGFRVGDEMFQVPEGYERIVPPPLTGN